MHWGYVSGSPILAGAPSWTAIHDYQTPYRSPLILNSQGKLIDQLVYNLLARRRALPAATGIQKHKLLVDFLDYQIYPIAMKDSPKDRGPHVSASRVVFSTRLLICH